MTSPSPESFARHFRRTLPWAIIAGALILYLLTLNHWVSLTSLPWVAKMSGWDWQPLLVAPLHFILTYPVRWIPQSAQFIAMNCLPALCAALTLGLLARSVILLPQDRT